MWEPLIELLSSPSDAIRMNTLWILGTAIQNNPKAQTAVSLSRIATGGHPPDVPLVFVPFPIGQNTVS